jgi:phosphatidylserine/phosphatidylglycerophosphate/cardiolipin synthase-like enzyme
VTPRSKPEAGKADLSLRRAALAVSILGALAIEGCASLPPVDTRVASTALTDTDDTRLGRAIAEAPRARTGESGQIPLANPKEAFAARVVLARAAQRSLDVQYYIWHRDTTGYLMLEELWNAAERGVRVRILLDDNGIGGLDPILAVFDGHPNIEVRIFNPFPNRGFKAIGFLTNFKRLNRRMHNKSLTADSKATIVGGRNIGDEYFGAGNEVVFADLDVLAIGDISGKVSGEFDQYWSSQSAYPAISIVGAPKPDAEAEMKAQFASVQTSAEAVEYVEAVRSTRLMEDLAAKQLRFDWSPMQLLNDDPAKTLDEVKKSELLLTRLKAAMGPAEKELDIVSPYFVPRKGGAETLSAYPERGVQLRIVTNSLAATDSGVVHCKYARYRKRLLRGGVLLYELKPNAPSGSTPPARKRSKSGAGGSSGSSSASLHAKTISTDRSRAFVGSFNLDPRSTDLNTEMGLVIESPDLASAISSSLDRTLADRAYEVRLTREGRLEWIERTAQGEVRYRHDPKTGFFKRLVNRILGWLPIESLL